MQIKLSAIKTAKGFNPRENVDRTEVHALALSMKTIGQLEPILVRENDFELVNGLHRLSAARKLGWKTIEAKLVKASDVEARILALASNSFGQRLNHLELGRNVHLILEGVDKRAGRGEVKKELAMKLGISVPELESCLATYRNLHPEARELSSYAVRKRVLKVEQLREIRQLPYEKQIAVLKQVVKAPDASTADRLVNAFIAAQGTAEPRGIQTKETEPVDRGSQQVQVQVVECPKIHVAENETHPPVNEIILARKLRLFKEVSFSATGTCSACHEEIELKQAKIEFDPPLWLRDLRRILDADLQKLSEEKLEAA